MSLSRRLTFLAVLLLILPAGSAYALPDYLALFNQDPMKKAVAQNCAVCHLDEGGGGGRNPFGEAFAENHEVTPLIRVQFSQGFSYPSYKVGNTTIHFSDPANKQIVIEAGDRLTVVDVPAKTVDGQKATVK